MSTRTVSLRSVVPAARFHGCDDLRFSEVTADSRRVRPGDLFVAVRGSRLDGHDFVEKARESGAVAAVVERKLDLSDFPQCVVADSADAYARLCMAAVDFASADVATAAVTGTNGKTTTTWLLRSVFQAAGHQSGLIGTVENSDGLSCAPSRMTTPDAAELARLYKQMRAAGTRFCALEISSHALVQSRCAAVPLTAAGVTNVVHDHLDYHGDRAAYAAAKARLAELLIPGAPLFVNADDPGCMQLNELLPAGVATIGFQVSTGGRSVESAICAEVLRSSHRSQHVRLRLQRHTMDVRLRLIGRHNAENALLAAALAEQMGIADSAIAEGLEQLTCVPGRLERIDVGQPFTVYVDYAHTADAVEKVIRTVRRFAPGRIICVIGAGGDRDVSKRPALGRAAAAADLVVLTSDNPRSEDPLCIIDDMLTGVPPGAAYVRELDRRAAIELAFSDAEPGDIVLLTGKGHECVQEIGESRVPFDDGSVAREILQGEDFQFGLPASCCVPLIRRA